jgi:hypothetical protein
VIEAVSNYGEALMFTSRILRNNKDVVIAAVLNNSSSLQYASQELQNDKELLLLLEEDKEITMRMFPKWYEERILVLQEIQAIEEHNWMDKKIKKNTIKGMVKKF